MVRLELIIAVTDRDLDDANRFLYDAYLDGHNEPDPDCTWDDLEPDNNYGDGPLEHLWMIYPF